MLNNLLRLAGKVYVFVLILPFIAIGTSDVGSQTALPFRLRSGFVTGLNQPVLVTNAGDGTRRLFIVQQTGIIKVLQPGATTPTNFIDLSSKITIPGSPSDERGLLGLTFHPLFESNGYFFVNYTRSGDGATIVSRYSAINNNSVGDLSSERIVIGPISQPFSNHNGGMIEFRQDSPGVFNLYIGMGDGGSGNDPGNRAQNINELLGKFLRITPDVSGNNSNPAYTIPADNPFVGAAGADEIYSVGFRNPFRFSFDRGGTNQLWAGDVGQGSWEEVDIVTRGSNYGWRIYEGNHCTNLDGCGFPANYVAPVFEYSSSGAGNPRCTVIGGYVYRGAQRAMNLGTYTYGDYCSGEIFKWENATQTVLSDTTRHISSFGEDEDGELYVVSSPMSGTPGTVDKILGNRTAADLDGDLKADLSVYRPSNSTWYTVKSSNGQLTTTPFGLPGDIPTPEDFDGDGIADIAVYRPATATWYVVRSSNNTYFFEQFGLSGDTPKPGDFDADGKADLNLYRDATGTWYTRRSTDGAVTSLSWGLSNDIPIPADFDGDNRMDYTVWRPSNGTWYTINSTNNSISINGWGITNDVPAPGDYDGDGKADLMVWRRSNGQWYLRKSSNSNIQIQGWGLDGDIPVASDWDGDTIDDIAVFRPTTGIWYIIGSSIGISVPPQWGLPDDQPVPKYDTP